MSRTYHHGERRIRVKGVRRNPPDLKRMSRALVELAKAQAEADAQSAADTQVGASATSTSSTRRKSRNTKANNNTKATKRGAA